MSSTNLRVSHECSLPEVVPCSSKAEESGEGDTSGDQLDQPAAETGSDGPTVDADQGVAALCRASETIVSEIQREVGVDIQSQGYSHKSICLVEANKKLMNLNVEINDTRVTAIIDTGSRYTLMAKDLAQKIQLNILPYDDKFVAFGKDSSFRILGVSSCNNVNVAGIPLNEMEILIYESNLNPSGDFFLGCDFLKNNNIRLSFRDRVLVKKGQDEDRVVFHLEESGSVTSKLWCNFNCYAAQDMTIPVNNPVSIPINFSLPSVSSDDVLLYSDDGMDNRLNGKVRGISGIVDTKSRRVLLVSGEGSLHVKKGQVVGRVSSVSELPEDDSVDEIDNDDDNPLSQVTLSELNVPEQSQVFNVLNKYKSVFSRNEYDVGHANVTEHIIRLSDDTPIYQRPRRFPPPIANEIERQCQELHALDIIEPSLSPWNSPIVPIVKKGAGLRLCLDYHKLNYITIPDRHPVPNLADSIFGLFGTKFFTRLDLVKSYYQIPIGENSRPYTAFSTAKNHWQFKRLSFGLRNAPSAFQREIQAVLSSFPSNKVIAYIDDILIMGSTFDEHLDLVGKVLCTLESYRLKIKPSKCEFFQKEVDFLGHRISQSGIRKTPEYVKRVSEYPRPRTKGELREFLGLVNFQRKFLPNCSVIQKPLSCQTSGAKQRELEWTVEMNASFETLKAQMAKEIELAYPDYSEEASKIELWVDASNYGAGSYLAQMQDGSHRVIGFASMAFDVSKMNYSTLERELCALRWGVKTFKPFLYGVPFILYTDHQPLVHLHNMRLVCSRLARTLEELADYTFEIRYVAGHLNSAADALSRINISPDTDCYNVGDSSLPDGLVIDGSCIPGGGDSMVLSLLRCLSRLTLQRMLPSTGRALRELLVDEVTNNASLYKLNLDRSSRRELRLMRHEGQLPSFDLLMAASRIFNVSVHVYFWSKEPVIFHFKEGINLQCVNLQCISGIHFNPLIKLCNYQPPDYSNCSINAVQSPGLPVCFIKEKPDELDLACSGEVSLFDNIVNDCNHPGCSLPKVSANLHGLSFCALLDSGAEISLIAESALNSVRRAAPVIILREIVGNAIGFSGDEYIIDETVELTFRIGLVEIDKPFKFAIVKDKCIPCCVLLGLNFMEYYNCDLDFSKNMLSINDNSAGSFSMESLGVTERNVLVINTNTPASHVLKISTSQDGFRFEIEGSSTTLNKLTLMDDEDEAVKLIQSRCPQLKKLYRCLLREIPPKKWPGSLKVFVRYARNLSIVNGVIFFSCLESKVIVVSHKFLTGIAMVLHNEYAHIGRDKLVILVKRTFWHPASYKICRDICVTCFNCQIMKEYSCVVCPPTMKIQSSGPFELVAADLISFPRTSGGLVGCLMVVDHYSRVGYNCGD